jgi:CPA1 family monovalent cation:H+ antiporter
VELTFTAVAAFGSFLLAEYWESSGVMAVLVAGLMIGNSSHLGAISEHGKEALEVFWEFAAFVANSVVFILIGVHLATIHQSLFGQLSIIAIGIFASVAGRFVSVYGVCLLFSRSRDRVAPAHQHVLFWGGLKGALSLALVLGLPGDFPFKEQLIAAAFGIVAFSLVVQGMTMPILMRRLGLVGKRG